MYTLMIVDDEEKVRRGLMKFVNWSDYGFEVVANAASAKQAVDIINAKHIDVILTDIVMPDQTGLELISTVKDLGFNIKFIILSGHGGFEYAQDAIRLGASDYLLKPIKFEELKIILNKLKLELDRDNNEIKYKEWLFKRLKEQFANNLAKGYAMKPSDVQEDMIRFNISGNYYCIIRIFCDSSEKSNLMEQLEKNTQRSWLIFNNNLTEIAILAVLNSTDSKEQINSLYEKIDVENIVFCIGKLYKDIFCTKRSYEEAGNSYEYRILKTTSNIIFYSDISKLMLRREFLSKERQKKIFKLLYDGDYDKFISFFDSLSPGSDDKRIIYDFCIEIILTINKVVNMISDNYERSCEMAFAVIKSILHKNDLSEIKPFLATYVQKCMSMISLNQEKALGITISKVIAYINEHYSEKVTLETLAEIVYVHPKYLSKLFRNKTGENFVAYLTRVRIDKAKGLLADGLVKIADVAHMVGYESEKHFSKIFHDMTGITPREYRNK